MKRVIFWEVIEPVDDKVRKSARVSGNEDSSGNSASRGMGTYAIYLLIVLVLGYFLFARARGY
jgi:hypothetical protein